MRYNLISRLRGIMKIHEALESEIEFVGIHGIVTIPWVKFIEDHQKTDVTRINPCFVVKAGSWFIKVDQEGELVFQEVPKPGVVQGNLPERLITE